MNLYFNQGTLASMHRLFIVIGLLSEMTSLRDEFERFMFKQAKYPAGETHGWWNDRLRMNLKPGLPNILRKPL